MPLSAEATAGAVDGFGPALRRLRQAQKAGKGAPPYSLYINRPLGRIFAAAAYVIGLTPNQVTYISAAFTFAGIIIVAVGPASVLTGIVVSVLLVVGYALDSADGQLARLRGGGSLLGEWLDHTIDSVKVASVHLAVMIGMYRTFDLDDRWMLVPIVFAIVSGVHFFGMILVDLVARVRYAERGLAKPSAGGAVVLMTLLKLPTDYGVQCLVFVIFGLHAAFLGVYTLLAVAMTGYTLLVIVKWRRDVIKLDAMK